MTPSDDSNTLKTLITDLIVSGSIQSPPQRIVDRLTELGLTLSSHNVPEYNRALGEFLHTLREPMHANDFFTLQLPIIDYLTQALKDREIIHQLSLWVVGLITDNELLAAYREHTRETL